MNGAIMVAVCTLGKVRASWALAFKGAVAPSGRTQHLPLVAGFPTAHARNVACPLAETPGYEILLLRHVDVVPRDTQALLPLLRGLPIPC